MMGLDIELIIDVDFNQDGDRMFGWYLYGYVTRPNGITSRYCSDSQLVVVLLPGIKEYRKLLYDNGARVRANDRTCFADEGMARSMIPILTSMINYNMLF